MPKKYDVIIIGAGAAGLTAGIYTTRKTLKTLILSKDIGGQATLTNEIENYPGYNLVDGVELMENFKKQAEKFGSELKLEEVEEIKKKNGIFLIKTSASEYESLALILAFGLTPRDLGVPGEEEYKTKGVSYCATCDAPLYKGKTVAVIGGGNSGLDASLLLSKIATKVYLIQIKEELTGDEILINQVNDTKNIEVLLNTEIKEVKGDNFVKGIMVKDKETNKDKEIKVDGVFVEIGYIAKTDFVKDLIKLDERNQIIVDKNGQTSEKGVFAAGDITDVAYKQIVISAGQGAKAALTVYKYLQEEKGKKAVNIDWGLTKK